MNFKQLQKHLILLPVTKLQNLAASLATNRTYLSSYIKTVYNVSFREWFVDLRISYAKQQLVKHPELTVAAISEASGFLSLSHFTKIFTKKAGCQPSKWRKQSITNSWANLLYQQFYAHFANPIFVLTSIICYITKINGLITISSSSNHIFSYLCHDISYNFL